MPHRNGSIPAKAISMPVTIAHHTLSQNVDERITGRAVERDVALSEETSIVWKCHKQRHCEAV